MSVTISAPVQYAMDEETLRYKPPECIICKQRRYTYYEPPWPSEYGGLVICGECHRKHLDDVIRKAIVEDGV